MVKKTNVVTFLLDASKDVMLIGVMLSIIHIRKARKMDHKSAEILS